MKKCILDDFDFNISYEEKIRMIKSAGFDSVFLNMRNSNKEAFILDYILEKVEICKKHNIKIEFAHLPVIPALNSFWTEDYDKDFLTYITSSIKLLADIGINKFVMHSYYKKLPVEMNNNIVKIFNIISKVLIETNSVLAIENVDFILQDLYVLNNVNLPYIGFCYDIGHENLFYPSNMKNYLLDTFGNKLLCLHLHSNNGISDEHNLPFDKNSTIDWLNKCKQLKQYVTDNIAVTLEVKLKNCTEKEDINNFLNSAFADALKLENMLKF